VQNLVRGWTEEMKTLMVKLGVYDVNEIRGARNLLEYHGYNPETAYLLGLGRGRLSARSTVAPAWLPPRGRGLWTGHRISMLRDMAGTTGKYPAEPEISSMGTTSPPFVEEPARLADWLVSDGAQVTRPSIDPYREEIEISTFLGQGKLRLSSPLFFTHLPEGTPPVVISSFARTALSMGLLFDVGSSSGLPSDAYVERLIAEAGTSPESVIHTMGLDDFLPGRENRATRLDTNGRNSMFLLRLPSSGEALERAARDSSWAGKVHGIIIDEDDPSSDLQLELAVALLDRQLKEEGLRQKLSLVAEGNDVRGADDVLKLLALGADCVGLGEAALIATGVQRSDKEMVLDNRITERLENLVVAMWREIKLLAGAAGVSSVSSTLTGNRELLRSVDLDSATRARLGVKPAGAT